MLAFLSKILAGWLAWLYTVAIAVAQTVLGAKATHVVLQFYDFEINHISINSFCRDIYKDTKNMAEVYLIIGIGSLVLILASLIWYCCQRRCNKTSWDQRYYIDLQPCLPDFKGHTYDNSCCLILDFGPLLASFFTSVTCMAHGAFLTWKLHSLSQDCRDFWDTQVSAEFLLLFAAAEKLLIVTGVVGGVWCIAACAALCIVGWRLD